MLFENRFKMNFIVCVTFVFLAELIKKGSTQQNVWLVPCNATTTCDTIINATCMDGYCNCGAQFSVCSCKEGYVAFNSTQCIEKNVLGTRCSTSEDCNQSQDSMNRFVCTNGECKCQRNYTEENGRCTENGTASSTSRLKDIVVLPWFLMSAALLLSCYSC